METSQPTDSEVTDDHGDRALYDAALDAGEDGGGPDEPPGPVFQRQVDALRNELAAIAARVRALDAAAAEGDLAPPAMLAARNELRQVNGDLEKFQFTKVDAIETSSLARGRDNARAQRKRLNAEVETLRATVQGRHAAICSELEKIPRERQKSEESETDKTSSGVRSRPPPTASARGLPPPPPPPCGGCLVSSPSPEPPASGCAMSAPCSRQDCLTSTDARPYCASDFFVWSSSAWFTFIFLTTVTVF